jgi:hypothetical protein
MSSESLYSNRAGTIAIVSAVDPPARKSVPWVNWGVKVLRCGGVELPIRRWVNISALRYRTLYPVALISTTQLEEGELGGVPRFLLAPPLIVCVAPSNCPVRGLYQLFWKLPELPLKSSVPLEVAFGRYTA